MLVVDVENKLKNILDKLSNYDNFECIDNTFINDIDGISISNEMNLTIEIEDESGILLEFAWYPLVLLFTSKIRLHIPTNLGIIDDYGIMIIFPLNDINETLFQFSTNSINEGVNVILDIKAYPLLLEIIKKLEYILKQDFPPIYFKLLTDY